MPESCEAVRILILNGDLPIFPGRAGHEYLHTTLLAQRAQKVGLVSMVHTSEQHEKKQDLVRAGVELYLRESPHLHQSSADYAYAANLVTACREGVIYRVADATPEAPGHGPPGFATRQHG